MTELANVLWIGGRSGAGKSTVARLLARRHGMRWYSCDTRTWEHRDRAIAAGHQGAITWERLTPMQRSQLTAADTIRLAIDRSAMVLDDVMGLPDQPAVVAEGTNVVPSMVPHRSLAIWLTPPARVRADRNRQRGWGAAGGEVDLIKERELLAELDRAKATVIETGDRAEPAGIVDLIDAIAADWRAERPTAADRRERQRLIREGNAAIVAQYRGGLARAGNTTGQDLVRAYDCECGDPHCTELVECTLGSLSDPFTPTARPILAPGHSAEPA